MQDVFLISATRTAIGSFGGSLKDTTPIDLGTHIAKAAIEKSNLAADVIDHAVIGNVIHTEPRDMSLIEYDPTIKRHFVKHHCHILQ